MHETAEPLRWGRRRFRKAQALRDTTFAGTEDHAEFAAFCSELKARANRSSP
jgi:hypothetical protein